MITEDYCSYEVIKLLKAKGFPIPDYKGFGVHIPSVTHALAMKWLREQHIFIEVHYYGEDDSYYPYVSIIKGAWYDSKNNEHDFNSHKTYEEAVEEALIYCLTELI